MYFSMCAYVYTRFAYVREIQQRSSVRRACFAVVVGVRNGSAQNATAAYAPVFVRFTFLSTFFLYRLLFGFVSCVRSHARAPARPCVRFFHFLFLFLSFSSAIVFLSFVVHVARDFTKKSTVTNLPAGGNNRLFYKKTFSQVPHKPRKTIIFRVHKIAQEGACTDNNVYRIIDVHNE